jgi:hypothetical protein
MKRGGFMTRSGRIKPKKRSASEFARIYGSKARVEWVKNLPCVCGCMRWPCDNAHSENEGKGRKGHHRTIVPLARVCHRAYDEHRAPFDTELAREAVKLHAAVTAVRWDYLGRSS